jgi:hypothetical protein
MLGWIAWVAYVIVGSATLDYLLRHIEPSRLRISARLLLILTVTGLAILWPLTWALIGVRRVKQVWRP